MATEKVPNEILHTIPLSDRCRVLIKKSAAGKPYFGIEKSKPGSDRARWFYIPVYSWKAVQAEKEVLKTHIQNQVSTLRNG